MTQFEVEKSRVVHSAEADELRRLYGQMVLLRKFDERVGDLFRRAKLPGFVHLYIGQEAIATGVCAVLRSDDYITSTHRGHGHFLARHGDPRSLMAELYGKESGCCRGKGGSLHVADASLGMLGANGIVAANLPIAVGAAYGAAKMRQTDQVVAAFFGDGATNEGAFHEAANLAGAWKLPVVFVCENNYYGVGTRLGVVSASESLVERAGAYGIPAVSIDGNDVLEVREAAGEAIERARSGGGPTFLECRTWRHRAHVEGEQPKYFSEEERSGWLERDPLPSFAEKLLDAGVLTEAELAEIAASAEARVDDAVAYAEAEPYPDAEDALRDVFAPRAGGAAVEAAKPSATKTMTFMEAIRETLRQEMELDPQLYVIGEDVGAYGGEMGVTQGLWEQFGDWRIRDAPIAETAIVGCAIGSALTGVRAAPEVPFGDFLGVCLDQVCNQAAKIRYMMGGQLSVPLVLRTTMGGYLNAAAQHSQCLEAWVAHVPGLKVVMPSTPADAAGLLRASLRDGNPVVFFEHKAMYGLKGEVPDDPEHEIPLGKANVVRPGTDITVFATGRQVHTAKAAAAQLEAEAVSVEVVDLRTLVPLDRTAILESVAKTRRAIVVTESWSFCGIGAEVAAVLAEAGFAHLDAPVKRIGAKHVPIPFSPPLENFVLPSVDSIVEAIREALA
jgi:2-oxoisovalerate dehydrogenase E1 component